VVRLLAPVRVVGQRKDRLYHPRVGISSFRREDDDRPGIVRVDELQIVDVDRSAAPTNDTGVLGIAHPLPNLVLHLDLVLLGQYGYARARAALVGGD
jgi:hypothetical protein